MGGQGAAGSLWAGVIQECFFSRYPGDQGGIVTVKLLSGLKEKDSDTHMLA